MDKEISEIIDKYVNDKNLRKFSNLYYPNYNYTEAVKSKEDMSRATIGMDATLNYYSVQSGLTDQDIEILERRIGEYELIVSKIFSESKNGNTSYNAYNLQTFIDNIYSFYNKLNDISKMERTTKSSIGYGF